jgi:hypothetical protein
MPIERQWNCTNSRGKFTFALLSTASQIGNT